MTRWGWVRRVGLVGATVAVVEYLVVPQVIEARQEISLFTDASPELLALAFVLEALSLLAYTGLTQAVLTPDTRLRFVDQLRIDLAGLGASHLLPGGGAASAGVRYRLMTERGVTPDDALSTAAVQTGIAWLGLIATFTLGVALALPGIWTHPAYPAAALAGLAALLVTALVLRFRSRTPHVRPPQGPPSAPRVVGNRLSRLVRGWADRLSLAGVAVVERSELLLRRRRARRRVVALAAGNWLFDAACLWVCLWAYGVTVHPGALLAAYGAANLVGLLPVTPGGLGVVEGVLIPSLLLLGADGGPVVLGVLTWRALEFWLPMPVAGAAYLSLRLGRRGPSAPHGDLGPGQAPRAGSRLRS
ncbi:YbhN family protein [Jannaschia sp. R86511]|uniref:lysylphosphatidylglycerol synthase transmembrane domain-containing protein n=1 Tax=Jannaschia sp. R86511 TaxID=3093853 RepID=UPI0036D3B431